MRTHPVDKLLEQHCYMSAAGLLKFVFLRVYCRSSYPSWSCHRGHGSARFLSYYFNVLLHDAISFVEICLVSVF